MLTGASGFVGSHIAEALIRMGSEPRLYVRQRTSLLDKLEKKGARIFLGTGPDDLIEMRKSLKGADVVIHCAAAVRAIRQEGYTRANVFFTQNILRLLNKDQRMVFISSQAAAGPSNLNSPVDEKQKPQPVNCYGISKLQAETIVRKWGYTHNHNYIILRPSSVFGPREKDFYLLFKSIKKGLCILPGDGRQRLSILHVDDLVGAILTAAATEKRGRTYFVCNDEPCSWLQIADAIKTALNKPRVLTLKLPVSIAGPLSRLCDAVAPLTGKPSLLSHQKVIEMKQTAWLCSNRRIIRDLGWRPDRTLTTAIAATADWYLREKWL
jgi:dihydroflavonol-4-reductase